MLHRLSLSGLTRQSFLTSAPENQFLHNNKNMFFCPQCGTKLGDIKLEETVKLDDGSEDVITHNVFGCPQCNKSYEKELEKFTKARTQ